MNDLLGSAVKYEEVHEVTRKRCGELAAYGMPTTQIADVVLISYEQAQAVTESPEYKNSYAKVVGDRAQQKIDLQEGWDAVEQKALKAVFETLEYNRDPHFSLMAARVANGAKRPKPGNEEHKVIDAEKAGATIVVLNMNRTYINNAKNDGGEIDIIARETREIPAKRIDMMTPKVVENMLRPPPEVAPIPIDDYRRGAIEHAINKAGLKFDSDE